MVVGCYADRLAGRLGPVVVRPCAVRVGESRPVARRSSIGGGDRFRPVVVRPCAVGVVESRPVATHYEASKTTTVRSPLAVTVAVIRFLLSPRSRKVIVAVPPPEALPKSAAAMSRSNWRIVNDPSTGSSRIESTAPLDRVETLTLSVLAPNMLSQTFAGTTI